MPLIFLAALAVRLTSRGPAFYTQTRVGKNGRLFTIWKIRSMIDNCESLTGARWSIPGDPRVTRVGAFLRASHLDELPQLLNVLQGEMSLIGPRPERPEFVPELERELPGYWQRLAVRPGVTGLAQVQLPPDSDLTSVRRKLAHDLYYIRHLSPWLDVRLLFCTAFYALGLPFGIAGGMLAIPDGDKVEEAMDDVLGDMRAPRPRQRLTSFAERSISSFGGQYDARTDHPTQAESTTGAAQIRLALETTASPRPVYLRHRAGAQRGGVHR